MQVMPKPGVSRQRHFITLHFCCHVLDCHTGGKEVTGGVDAGHMHMLWQSYWTRMAACLATASLLLAPQAHLPKLQMVLI